MPVNPSDRIQPITASLMKQPCTCMVCGRGGQDIPVEGIKSTDEVFVDLNTYHEWDYIQCYLCRDCTASAAAVFNMLPEDKAKALVLQNRELLAANSELRTRTQELENAIDILSRERLNSRDDTLNGLPIKTHSEFPRDFIMLDKTAESDNQRIENLKPEFTEPAESTGPGNITGDASDDGTKHESDTNSFLAELGL